MVRLIDDLEELDRRYLLGIWLDDLKVLPDFQLHGRLLLRRHRHELLRLFVVVSELIGRKGSLVGAIEYPEDLP